MRQLTLQEFNEKYKYYIEDRFEGLSINDERVICYLDELFQSLIKLEGFKFSQIKCKFNNVVFYSNLNSLLGNFLTTLILNNVTSELNLLLKYKK